MKKCINCGTELKDEAKFCDACGTKQETQVIENVEPNELVEENKNEVIEITELPEAEKSKLSDKTKKCHKITIIICIIAVLVVIAGVVTTICIVNNSKNSNEETSTVNTLTFDDAYSIYAYFKENLEFIGDYIEYDEKTDPNQKLGKNNSYIAKLNFEITYIEQSDDVTPDLGASIEIFKNNDDAKSRSDYLNNLSFTQDQGNYVCGNVLLRVTEQAKAKDMSSLKDALSEFMKSPKTYEKSNSDIIPNDWDNTTKLEKYGVKYELPESWCDDTKIDGNKTYFYPEEDTMLMIMLQPNTSIDLENSLQIDSYLNGIADSEYSSEIISNEVIELNDCKALEYSNTMTLYGTLYYCHGITINTDNGLLNFYLSSTSSNKFDNDFEKLKESIYIGTHNTTVSTTTTTTTTTQKKTKAANPVIYKDKTVKITYKGIDEDDVFGTELNFTIENLSKKNIIVQARDVSINGIMVNPIFSCNVSAGKIANDDMSFLNLEDDGIDKIKTVELSFHIFDDDSWDTIVDTKVVKIKVS